VKTVNTILILAAAFVIAFLEAAIGTRSLLGAQIDLLPALVVYASLTAGLTTLALLAVCGGVWFDALSANPLGISILPLFVIGFFIQRQREFILRDQVFAQFTLGLIASGAAPLLTLLLLFSGGHAVIAGWGTLWQWFVMTLGGGALTPVVFRLFRLIGRSFFYQPLTQTSFRHDRQIQRGRR
jgi:rod shape-determining protein MreD